MKAFRIDSSDVDDRKLTLQDVVQSVQIDNVKVCLHTAQPVQVMCTAVAMQYRKDIIDDTTECHLPINEARNCGKGLLHIEEARTKEGDV